MITIRRIVRTALLNFALRELSKETDSPGVVIPDKVEREFLATLWENAAFRNYVKERDFELMRAAAGASIKEPPRDDAIRFSGQRFEILRLANAAKQALRLRNKELLERGQKPSALS